MDGAFTQKCRQCGLLHVHLHSEAGKKVHRNLQYVIFQVLLTTLHPIASAFAINVGRDAERPQGSCSKTTSRF